MAEVVFIRMKKIVANGMSAIVFGLFMLWLGRNGFAPVLPVNVHLILHNIGVIMFMGSIVTSLMWAIKAHNSNQNYLFVFTIRNISTFDNWFIKPGVLLIVINGLYLSNQWGGVFGQPWIYISMILFVLSGVIWTFRMAPLQKRILTESDMIQSPDKLFLKSDFSAWLYWGVASTILPMVALFLMLIKPDQ